jgi:4-hydroxythreonine-4-phosphate dehydrogenase
MKKTIAITVGDYNGIGPEVSLKTIARSDIRRVCTPVLIGPGEVFERMSSRLHLGLRFHPYSASTPAGTSIAVLEPSVSVPVSIRPGVLSARAGAAAGAAIKDAVRFVCSGEADGMVTAPVSKLAMNLAGFKTPGQTELLQRLTHAPHVAMMLVHDRLRVGLVTIHLPLRRVAQELTAELLRVRISVIRDALRQDWKIPRPRLAVLALNPHAGEGGDLGHEEQRIIVPVVLSLRKQGMSLDGPFPADSFFARYRPGSYDAVVAMYHDQGLIPLKMSAGGTAVNVSVGLPIVRTSPDHGTAFDIARREIAGATSMVEAVKLAVIIARNRSGKRKTGTR